MIGLNRLDAHQPLMSNMLFLSGHDTISQSFYASVNDLNIVSICLRNPARLLAPLEFSLHEATTSAVPIRTISFSTGNIDNQDCTRFQFFPVSDSAGKTYVAQIKRTANELENPLTSVHAEVYPGVIYPKGQAYRDNIPTEYDLHFKTNYYQSIPIVARESFTQFVSHLGKDPIFVLVYIVIVAFILYRLFWKKHER